MDPTHDPAASPTTGLVGSRCAACGNIAFPAATACQRCGARVDDTVELSRHGVVWGYTVQRFPPKSPPYVPPAEGFTPFAVGYVELPEGVKVEALLDSLEFDDLADAAVTLVAVEPVPRFATDRMRAGAS